MSHPTQHRQITQFAARIRKELAANGQVITAQVRRWLDRLAQLVARARVRMSGVALRAALGSLAGLFGLSGASAQTFAPMVPNEFGMELPGGEGTSSLQLVDLDADGDLDLVTRSFGYDYYSDSMLPTFRFHENVGTPDAPQYLPGVENPFGGLDAVTGWDIGYSYGGLMMDFADLDADGDLDFVAVDRYGYFYNLAPYAYGYYANVLMFAENIGTPAAPAFGAFEINPFNANLAMLSALELEVFAFDFADVDGDGDLDMMGSAIDFYAYSPNGEVTRGLFWCQNVGSASAPSFAAPAMAPMGLPDLDAGDPAEGLSFGLQMVDLDADGDLDLTETVYLGYSGKEYLTEMRFFENTGNPSSPAFAAHIVSPFGLELAPADGIFMAQFADVDGDGDPDAFFCDFYGTYESYDVPVPLLYQENTSPVGVADWAAEAAESQPMLKVYPNPASAFATLQFEANETVARGVILDAQGREVHAAVLGNNAGAKSGTIALPGLPSGRYVLQLITATGAVRTSPFVVSGN